MKKIIFKVMGVMLILASLFVVSLRAELERPRYYLLLMFEDSEKVIYWCQANYVTRAICTKLGDEITITKL